ncbi:MAG: N-formylglutamate amidohydrolase [Planctomycetota bacterium]
MTILPQGTVHFSVGNTDRLTGLIHVTILITCETSGDAVLPWMESACAVGDAAAIDVCGGRAASWMADQLHAPRLCFRYRRDLIDASLSLGHRRLFGPHATQLSDDDKLRVIESAYRPYRDQVGSAVRRMLEEFSFVLHLSVRSFAAKHHGAFRRTDVGLLYDPSREAELNLCVDWIDELYEMNPNVRVRRNYPRRGTVDSLTRSLRREIPAEHYMGVEVWLNRAWAAREVRLRDEAIWYLADSLRLTLGLPTFEATDKVA